MRSPPHGQNEREQQAIQVGPVHNPTGLDVEATTFAILKGCFHAHAPGICLDLSTPSSLITDKQPWIFTSWIPHEADVCIQRLFLPHTCCAIPARAWLEHDLLKALP